MASLNREGGLLRYICDWNKVMVKPGTSSCEQCVGLFVSCAFCTTTKEASGSESRTLLQFGDKNKSEGNF